MSTFEMAGLTEFRRALMQLEGQLPALAAAVLYREAEAIMTHVKQDYVPVDTGALKASGQVALPDIGVNSVSVEMGFGGAAVKYAIHVHEIPPTRMGIAQARDEAYGTPQYRRSPLRRLQNFAVGGKGWKYLERAVNDARAGLDARLSVALGREIARLAGTR